MATQLQLRRGTNAQVTAFTGAEGEVSVNTTNDSLHVHDGSTQGGFELARADLNNVSDTDLNAALNGNTIGSLTLTSASITNLTLGGTAVTSTAAELNILDGVTSDATELNLVDGSSAGTIVNSAAVIYGAAGEVNATTLQIGGVSITSTPAEINLLDGVTATTAELNILDGVTATATEINLLDGVTATTTELNYVDGVTSAIQTQLDAKAPIASPTFTGTVTVPGLTTTADVSFGDNDKAIFGAGSDLQIFHDGSHSYITDTGIGDLRINGASNVDIRDTTGVKMFRGVSGGEAILYHNNNDKLATTSTGIDVTGEVIADSMGIGTSSPNALVDLEDTTPTLRLTDDRNITWSGNETLGNIEFFSSDTSASGAHVTGFIKSINDRTGGSTQVAGALTFGVADYDTAASEVMRLDSSGHVGIGTSSPASLVSGGSSSPILSVGGSGGVLTTGDKTGTLSFITSDASYTATYSDGIAGEIASVSESSTGAAYGLAFYTGTISGTDRGERVRIDSSGNVGIGVTPFSAGGNGGNLMIGDPTSDGGAGLTIGSTTTGDIQFGDATTGTGRYAGLIRYVHSDDDLYFWTASSAKARIASDGKLIVPSGVTLGTTIGSSGASNTLDDYEEGTWTPYTTNGTISYNYARYVRVGNLVTVSGYVHNFSNRTTAVGIVINGLPFAANSNGVAIGATLSRYINAGTGGDPVMYTAVGHAYLNPYVMTKNSNYGQVYHSHLSSASSLMYFSITYETS